MVGDCRILYPNVSILRAETPIDFTYPFTTSRWGEDCKSNAHLPYKIVYPFLPNALLTAPVLKLQLFVFTAYPFWRLSSII